MRKPAIILGTTAVIISAASYLLWPDQTPLSANGSATPMATDTAPVSPSSAARYVFDVSLHTADEIDSLLTQAEKLSQTTELRADGSEIALVLHGPEIEIFAKKNYEKYRTIVDRAARLDANGVITIKMCQAQMRNLGIGAKEIPQFIELVPFGPDEVQRLKGSGYVYL